MNNSLQQMKINIEAQTKQYFKIMDTLYEDLNLVNRTISDKRLPSAMELAKMTDSTTGEQFAELFSIFNKLAWGFTKKIYKLDEDLVRVLAKAKLDLNTIDGSVIDKLPNFGTAVYCPYTVNGMNIIGFIINVDYGSEVNHLMISIIHMHGKKLYDMDVSIGLQGGFGYAVNKFINESIPYGTIEISGSIDPSFKKDILTYVMSVAMYMCSENFSGLTKPTSNFPKLASSNKGKFKLPKVTSIVPIGTSDGNAIRSFNKTMTAMGTGRTVTPHIRRAHWHTYWVGTTGSKAQVLKFIPASFVNIDKTMHAIK
jgi:hypothetical protein